MTDRPTPRLLVLVAVGGAVGAVARWAVGEAAPVEVHDFPWPTLLINVVGSFLLALLPVSRLVRRRQDVAVALGPGLLGGFTTLSAYSEQTRVLVDDGHPGTALVYLLGTLGACLAAVSFASGWSSRRQQRRFVRDGGER